MKVKGTRVARGASKRRRAGDLAKLASGSSCGRASSRTAHNGSMTAAEHSHQSADAQIVDRERGAMLCHRRRHRVAGRPRFHRMVLRLVLCAAGFLPHVPLRYRKIAPSLRLLALPPATASSRLRHCGRYGRTIVAQKFAQFDKRLAKQK